MAKSLMSMQRCQLSDGSPAFGWTPALVKAPITKPENPKTPQKCHISNYFNRKKKTFLLVESLNPHILRLDPPKK